MRSDAATDYDALYRGFAWDIPEFINIGVEACDRHATGEGHLALVVVDEAGGATRYSFDDLKRLSNRFANLLLGHGLARGDRVGVLLPQGLETAVAHLGTFKAGMISLPLFTLFGDDALEHRLGNAAARVVVTDSDGAAKLARIRDRLPALEKILVIGKDRVSDGNLGYDEELARASESFEPVRTRADDPALIIYTSGTTGSPKGALHGHRVLRGHLPSLDLVHDGFPQPGDLHWTPADWAWIGGLFDMLFPSWFHRVPVVAHRARKFDPHFAMRLMAEQGVRNVFLPPTALRLLRAANVPAGQVRLRSMMTGGEALGSDIVDWVRETFGTTPHEVYGQTECNLVIATNSRLFPLRPGSMGKAVPGHVVDIVDESGSVLPAGQEGMIGVRRPDPIMLLEYWRNPDATAAKFAGEYLLTGDLARKDEEGYFWYSGRADDVITSAGYRIGPTEIEDCLMRHPKVARAAVVGIPDPVRTEAIKAWIVLRPGETPSPALVEDIQAFVRTRLAAYEYPRHVAFIDELPTTITGKVLRRELRARG